MTERRTAQEHLEVRYWRRQVRMEYRASLKAMTK